MPEKFLMPKLSPTMEEGQIARWTKNEGDSFAAGETLAEVDTDKATMEMTALTGGTLLKILKVANETAALGEPIAIVGNAGEDFSALLAELQNSGKSSSAPPIPAPPETPQAEEKVEQTPTPETKPTETPVAATESEVRSEGERTLISPIAARMASENGIDLRTLKGSGPNGRIIKRDIETAMQSNVESPQAKVQDDTKTVSAPAFAASQVRGASAFRDEPTTPMRRVIANRLIESIGPIPTFYLTVEIETDNALALRKQINANLADDAKISVNDIIVKVTANSLTAHPFANASYQDKSIRFYEDADIGVAVAVTDGLITPIVRGANKKGFARISAEVKEMAARARERKLHPEEYTGATFSVSNLGMFGIEEFTAIINPPEAAILAIGKSEPKPVVRNGEIVVRNIMKVTMSCDHRVIDGATGAKFLQTFKQMMENPLMLLL